MLKELKQSYGFRPLIILDNSATHGASADILHGGNVIPLEKIIEKDMAMFAEVLFLLENTRTIVISEVRDEFREFVSRLKTVLHSDNDFMRVYRDALFGGNNMPMLQEYLEVLERLKEGVLNKDPREKTFGYTNNFGIDRNSNVYRETFDLAMQETRRREEMSGRKSKHPTTDSHLLTVAHVYENMDYEACIMTNDGGIIDLAKSLRQGAVEKVVSGSKTCTTVIVPNNNYIIRFFMPRFLETDYSRQQMTKTGREELTGKA